MDKTEFQHWQASTGYDAINDWNMQQIGSHLHYFIKNYETNKYALIKELYSKWGSTYEVLVEGWTDFNGW